MLKREFFRAYKVFFRRIVTLMKNILEINNNQQGEEKKLIPYGGLAIWLHYTGVHIERFNDFSNHFLSEEFLKYWIHTVNQWMEFNEIKV